MASYGIPSAGKTLTASVNSDTIKLSLGQTAEQSSTNVYGLAGNDVISFAALGDTVTGSAQAATTVTVDFHATGGATASASTIISGAIVGNSATYTFSATTTGHTANAASGAGGFTVDGSAKTAAFLTSQRSVRYIVGSTVDAADGNDAVYLGNEIISLSASTLAGGAGNDTIGFWTYNDQSAASSTNTTAATVNAAFFDGGAGNDTIDLSHDAGGLIKATTVQGGQGADTITLSADASTVVSSVYVLGGGGNDTIVSDFQADSIGNTVAGGGGADSLTVNVASTASATLILGDALNSIDAYDGADTIVFSAAASTAVTIQGMGGNDYVTADVGAGGGTLIQTNVGDDSVYFSGDFDSSQIQLGAGNDLLVMSAANAGFGGTDVNSAYIYGGGGNDTIKFIADISSAGGYEGAGADVFSADDSDVVSGAAFTFGYSAASDSTLTAMDTIAFMGASTVDTFRFNYLPGSTDAGSFSATNATASNGFVTFTSTYAADVTARASYVDSQMTTAGASVVFRDGSNINYLFVQGGSDDLVVALGDAANTKTISMSASTAIVAVTFS